MSSLYFSRASFLDLLHGEILGYQTQSPLQGKQKYLGLPFLFSGVFQSQRESLKLPTTYCQPL